MISIKQFQKDVALRFIHDGDAFLQRLSNSYQLWKGDYSFVPSAGVDWLEEFQSVPNPERLRKKIEAVLLADPEIVSIDAVEVVDKGDRSFQVAISGVSVYGRFTTKDLDTIMIIDDTEISTETTWSSDMLRLTFLFEDFEAEFLDGLLDGAV